MKKLLLLILPALLLTACSSDDGGNGAGGGGKHTPSTQVYVNNTLIEDCTDFRFTKSSAYAGQSAVAYFFIRIDGRIPGMGACSPSLYFPRTNSSKDAGSVFAAGNRGYIKADYPYWKALDYATTHIGQYIYDTTGKKVLETLTETPSLDDIISANQDRSIDFTNLKKDGLKIIWYVTKYEYGHWHVDGVLTFESTSDITDVPGIDSDNRFEDSKDEVETTGNIEVDIHQQEHNTWDEVKTSIHIRDLVENVRVEIPIGFENVAESDDFALRIYDLELESKVFINGTEYALDSTNPVKVTIEHQADKVVITATCTDKKYLDALKKEYGDGVTIEVHTYPKDLSKADAWAKIKQSTVKVSPATYKGLIFKGATSAFFTE